MSKYTKDTFKEIRKENFDRYLFYNCKQEVSEPLEQIHNKINQKTALCNWAELEDSLVKSILYKTCQISIYRLIYCQEDREPIGTLQYALARKRGQENQQTMKYTQWGQQK